MILITDFGQADSYVGSLKGAIYRISPETRIDEITHLVPPFDCAEGARILREAAAEYPPGTIFVAVVDPGVGTERRAIAARCREGKFYVGPDNGLLSLALGASGIDEVRQIDPSRWGKGVRPASTTFHGRDIFGPAAGRLAAGEDLRDLGPEISEIVTLKPEAAEIVGGAVRGRVTVVDRYGNLITDIPVALVRGIGGEPGKTLVARLGSQEVRCPWVGTYADVPLGSPLCLENSQGLLEIAERQGDLARRIGVRRGTPVEVVVD